MRECCGCGLYWLCSAPKSEKSGVAESRMVLSRWLLEVRGTGRNKHCVAINLATRNLGRIELKKLTWVELVVENEW